jgi:hypothetical protein
MWSSGGDRRARAALAAAALSWGFAAGCEETRTIDVCGRGDEVALEGGLVVSFLDEDGAVLAFRETSPAPRASFELDVPGGATEVLVEGRDGGGVVVAHGRGALEEGGACVCFARDSQYLAACEGIACRQEGGTCGFVDAASGQAAGARTLTIGENADDALHGAVDTFLDGSLGNELRNFGATDRIEVNSDTVGLFWFDLRALPTVSQVDEAAFTLIVPSLDGDTSLEMVFLSPVLEAWEEGLENGADGCASWMCRQPDVPWTTVGCGAPGSRADTALGYFVADVFDTPIGLASPALAERVQGWIADPATNFGLAASCGCGTRYASREGSDGLRPRLSVTYRLP